ncbi:hypothetical protein K0B03_02505 [Patescibacteria group bacterium]|nr:hypothetical protein [Patescibacteria group bacterium]
MSPRQEAETVRVLDRALKIAGRSENFYDIRRTVINIIIFTFAVIEIVFMAVWLMDKFFQDLPSYYLLLKYIGIPVLLLLVFVNPITDRIVKKIKQ